MTGRIHEMQVPEGYRLVTLEAIDSTNDEAKRQAEKGAPSGTVIWARRQSEGRGRRGRPWVSPPGNLYCSVLLRPDMAPAEIGQLSFVTALALADAVQALLPPSCSVRLKWPNDLLIEGRKAAGILLESAGGNGRAPDWLIVGTGVNVATHPVDGTSLRAEGAVDPIETVLEGYLEGLEYWLGRRRREGFAPVRAAWLDRAEGLGGAIEVRLADEVLTGTFAALDERGALILEGADGGRRAVVAGEVFFAPATPAGGA